MQVQNRVKLQDSTCAYASPVCTYWDKTSETGTLSKFGRTSKYGPTKAVGINAFPARRPVVRVPGRLTKGAWNRGMDTDPFAPTDGEM